MNRLITLQTIFAFGLLSVKCHAQNYSIGSSLTASALGSLNIEASGAISGKVSFHLPLLWTPFQLNEKTKLKLFALQPGARWWFWHVYSGFFAGTYATYARFNAGIYNYRHDGYAFGVSFSGGYTKMLTRRWNIEIELGGGLFYTKYDLFLNESCGEYLSSTSNMMLVPSKVNISFVYIL